MYLPSPGNLLPLIVLPLSLSVAAAAPPDPGPVREVRAVWITTAAGLDWPTTANPAEQKQALRRHVATLHAAGFNTLFFQVRARGDAYYRSGYEPWAENLTGTLGLDPGWDPLEFLLAEAHNRGMEVHAWFNVFKVRGQSPATPSSPPHVSLARPDWCVLFDNELWLDPGFPEARSYLLTVALDLVRRYRIDGINFDFIRYPGRTFDDSRSWRDYGTGVDRDAWRRRNIDVFVAEFYRRATALRPRLRVGSSPIGVYENDPLSGTWGSYVTVFQDSYGWLNRGHHDYLSPQLYWNIGASRGNPDFATLCLDWSRRSAGRHVIAGIAAYKDDIRRELPGQIDTARNAGLHGQSFFRLEHVLDTALLGGRYQRPAVIPAMPWKDSIPPLPPPHLAVTEVATNVFLLEWSSPPPARDGDTAKFYAVYRSAYPAISPRGGGTLARITTGPVLSVLDSIRVPEGFSYTYAVTAYDHGYNESPPSPAASGIFRELLAIRRSVSDATSLSAIFSSNGGVPSLAAYSLARRTPVQLNLLLAHPARGDSVIATLVQETQNGGMYVIGLGEIPFARGSYTLRLRAGSTVVDQPLEIR